MTRPMHQDAAVTAVLRRTMVLLLLLLMFSFSSFPSVTAECPDKCSCYESVEGVYCAELKLDRIPDRIPPATKTLSLRNNYISELKNGTFSNLSKIQTLLLGGNKIENIETGVFNNLTCLGYLDLDSNKIHNLDLEMFKGLTKLKDLYLGHNMIRTIPPGIFDSLTSLRILRLDHNPLTCDCNILLFVNTLKKNYPQRNVFYDYDPTCHFPVEMKEKSLKEITENDFNCTSPETKTVSVSVGEQLQISCNAVGDQEPFITWSKDEINLELGQRVQVFQNNTLIISKVEETDGGRYKCVASNSLGRKSFETMVNVNT